MQKIAMTLFFVQTKTQLTLKHWTTALKSQVICLIKVC